MVVLSILAITCCAGPLFVGAMAGGALSLIFAAHQTLVADITAIIAVVLAAWFIARRNAQSMLLVIVNAFRLAFSSAARLRSVFLVVLVGVPLTIFYLIALPAERFGAISWGALQFVTPGDALAAVLIGLGVPASITLNVAARKTRATETTVTFGGLVAALLPSSLCCTTLIPSALAAFGASAPAIMHTSGRYQAFFAQYAAAFIGFAVAAVLFSLWLAVSNLIASCTTCHVPTKELSQ